MTTATQRIGRGHSRGLSLIELMVTLVIGAVMVIAISTVMMQFEARKRRTTAVNDANQSGSYSLYVIDRWLRSAGSGFSQAGPEPDPMDSGDREAMGFGCRVLASKSGTQVLPYGTTFPPPFDRMQPVSGSNGTIRLAPALIASGHSGVQGFNSTYSDVLLVMAGMSGYAEIYTQLTGAVLASSVPVQTTASINGNDLVMLIDERSAGGAQDCMVQQVAATVTSPVGLSGTYAQSTISGFTDSNYDDKSVMVRLGNSTTNPPNFFAVGVGSGATLYAYDLLQTRSPALQAMADNVFELHAVYGVDTDDNNTVDSWVDPTATTSDFHVHKLMDGTSTAANRIATIKALRVALVLRSPLMEKSSEAVTASTLTVFPGETFARTRTLSTDDQRYRYRIVDSVIPLRNPLLAR
jgi:type IV pilus assembly protein PilW